MDILRKNKKTSLFIQGLSILISVLVVLSVFNFNFVNAKAEEQEIWDGTKASGLADFSGSGTEKDPYLIENASQLAYIVSTDLTDGLYFELVKDIKINDTSKANWKETAKNWVWADVRFVGHFNGNGHTIDGLFHKGSQKRFGLFSYVGNSVFENVRLTNASVTTSTKEEGSGIFSSQASEIADYRGIYIDETCEVSAPNSKGVAAIVARSNKNINISNCTVHAKIVGKSHVGAFYGTHWGGTQTLNNCYTTSSVPVMSSRTLSNSKNNYALVADSYGTTVLTADQMKGEAARTNMPGLDFERIWKIVEDGYPVIRENPQYPWNGEKASEFAGGSGTEDDPFLVSNAAQLYKMVADYSNYSISSKNQDRKYFRITDDIYLDDKQWYSTGVTSYPNNETAYTTGFSGVIYGDGHTIYGLYSNKSSATVGLIPLATQGTEIYDLHLEKGNLPKAAWNTYAVGGFIGMARGVSNSAPIVFKGCSVKDFKIESRDASSAFVGYLYSQSVEIYNSYSVNNQITHTNTSQGFNSGGFIGITYGNDWLNHIIVSNSYCIDVSPLPYLNEKFAAITSFENVYTNFEEYDGSVSGVTKLTQEQMKGENAKQNMSGFDFETAWKIVEDDYPVNFMYVKPDYIWDGKTADEFAGGSGTPRDPYLIENGGQLYKMVKEYTTALTAAGSVNSTTYFKLTKDIYLNDVKMGDLEAPSEASWGAKFNPWYSANNKEHGFNGDLDGNGFTVYGLYCPNTRFSGLITVLTDGGNIHNLNLKNSYIKGYECAGSIVGTASGNYLLASTSVSYCTVENVVVCGGGKQVGAIVGGCNDIGLTVSDCSVTNSNVSSTNSSNPNLASGLIGYGWGGVKKAVNCFTDNSVHPVTAATDKADFDIIDNYVEYTNVYTSFKKNFDAAEGVTYLSDNDKLKGNSVSNVLKGFNFTEDWLANSEYPTIKPGAGMWLYDSSLPGEVWSGKVARFYESGNGTKEAPFEIKTGGQLALLANDALNGKTLGRYYKITEDIILNNTSSKNWKKKANQWYTGTWAKAFRGYLDGGYHIVSGLYLNKTRDNYTGKDYYGGLFACISKNAVIEKLGIVNSSLVFTGGADTKYVGAFVGFVDQYKLEEATPEEYPIIRECFADTTVYLESSSCGGFIGCATRPIRVENSFFTGKVNSTGRGLFGYSKLGTAIEEVLVKNFYTADSSYAVFSNNAYDNIICENCYSSSAQDKEGLTRLFIDRMCGKEAKKYMKGFDFNNVWTIRGDKETPGLKGFGTNSYNNVMNPADIVVNFESNCDILVESIKGKAFSKLKLPILKRDGYIFEGWYAFPELDVPYEYDYFPTFDTILYAKWTLSGIAQDFELYEDSMYDYHEGYEYYRPTVPGYSAQYVRSGAKSMHRFGGTDEELDFLVFYKDELEIGKTYKMVFYTSTDLKNASVDVSLVHLDWPDVYCDNNGVAKVTTLNNLKGGEWKETTFTFVARSKWVAIRTSSSDSVYFDDFILYNTNERPTDSNVVISRPNVEDTLLPENENIQSEPEDSVIDSIKEEENTENTGDTVQSKPKNKKKKAKTNNYLLIIIIVVVAVVVLISGAVVTIILIAKKRKKKIN